MAVAAGLQQLTQGRNESLEQLGKVGPVGPRRELFLRHSFQRQRQRNSDLLLRAYALPRLDRAGCEVPDLPANDLAMKQILTKNADDLFLCEKRVEHEECPSAL